MRDIPGLEWEAPVVIDRTKLPGHDKEPVIRRFEFDDDTHESLAWGWVPLDGPDGAPGGMRAARTPAGEHLWAEDLPALSTEQLVQRVWEALELPDTAFGYHMILQGAYQELWARRRREPMTLNACEHLAWVDLRLVRAHPPAAGVVGPGDCPVMVVGFQMLIGVYRREGFLNEALEVARLAAETGQHSGAKAVADLEARLAAVLDEDGAGKAR